jgi:hypothetical protein
VELDQRAHERFGVPGQGHGAGVALRLVRAVVRAVEREREHHHQRPGPVQPRALDAQGRARERDGEGGHGDGRPQHHAAAPQARAVVVLEVGQLVRVDPRQLVGCELLEQGVGEDHRRAAE